jgi:futalosine hydrolase
MNVLIVSATRTEVQPLLDVLENLSQRKENLFYGSYRGNNVSVLLTGVGMVATAYHCAKEIKEEFDLAINAGICGSFNRNLELGDVLNVYEDMFSELGAEDGETFLTLEQLGLPGITRIRNSRENFNNEQIHSIPRVTGITVNKTHGSDKSIEAVFSRFHPYVESMEGAAFMFACEQEQIPYLQIRAVSNYVEKRNRENWNISLAVKNLNEKIVGILSGF